MAYMEQLQSGLGSLVAAAEAGRRSADEMLGPMNGAISDISGAALELESLPVVGPALGAKLQRTMRSIGAAQSAVGEVAAKYSQIVTVAGQMQQRLGALQEQVAKAGAAINRIGGQISPALGNIFPSGALAPQDTPAAEAVKPFPHLLILQPLGAGAEPFYFNLDTAAFDELRRQTGFRWAAQERLSRGIAQQAVGQGDDKISLKGAIYPGFKGGLGQLQALRSIGRRLQPLSLTTGYGEVLGTWCLTSIDEEQSHLLAGGIPRKQGFSLEFVSYGNDLQNL
ncbi:phage protein U [Pseudomonas protegens]|jgi:phage protein U|uniref:phage tail protein n=1 Tax=Pseudomonas TaxID=286 RepID=UPI000F4A9567|nr:MULTISPECIES: phage tail protein [Pseudomonas]MBB1616313.1 phage tail protein [Pseudomonas sp. UMC65]MBB1618903.1 phage tail protein [Pseudomonas sp. UME65]MDT3418809.1 phage protein U [Pseudomonas protegens]ROM21712.1 phage tail protein [Pseudomonas protegens]